MVRPPPSMWTGDNGVICGKETARRPADFNLLKSEGYDARIRLRTFPSLVFVIRDTHYRISPCPHIRIDHLQLSEATYSQFCVLDLLTMR